MTGKTARLCIGIDEVHLWTVPLDGPDRRAHAAVALRGILARYLGLEPAGVAIERDARGRPLLARGGGPAFNMSHSGALAAIAVTGRPAVGIDIESLERRPLTDALVERALSETEAALVRSLPEPERHEAFLRHWVAKESYAKALGEGLAAVMSGIAIADALTQPSLADPGPDPYRLQRFDPAPGYVGAVAVAGGPWRAQAHT